MTRAALIVIIVIAVVLAVAPPTRVVVSIGAAITIIAAIVALAQKQHRVPASSPAHAEPKQAPQKRPETALVATVSSAAGSDLHRVLAGIIGDERGKVVSSNGGPIVATFGTASAAVHAAQRMLSNVDALGRRLDRFIALGVGIDDSIDDATRLEQLTHEKRIAVLVSVGVATVVHSASLAAVEEGLYSFTPAQQRLPGF